MGLISLPPGQGDLFLGVLVLFTSARTGRPAPAEDVAALRALAVHEGDELAALAREARLLGKTRSATFAAAAADACRRLEDVLEVLERWPSAAEDALEVYREALREAARA